LNIVKKLNTYNEERKELAKKFNPDDLDLGYGESVNHVTEAKGRLKDKTKSQ